MTGKNLYAAFISDIHLGHRRVPTDHILSNLRQTFPSTTETAALDILFIGGDVYDRLLNLPDDQVNAIRLWIIDLLKICKKYNILLRVLAGTGSHDRGQGKEFTHLNAITGIKADCQYIDRLSIEHIDSLDIDVLYIPDEWRATTDETWLDTQQCLQDHGLSHVDFAIMHGVFEFQLPSHLNIDTHDSERYLSITRQYISIGHHHVMRQHKRIFAQGSFDRLAHGEEGAKGHIRVKVTAGDDHSLDEIQFIENTKAYTFKTLDLTGLSTEDSLKAIDDLLKYPVGSHFRLVVFKSQSIYNQLASVRDNYPEYHWTTKVDTEQTDSFQSALFKNNYKAVAIKPDDIVPRLIRRIEGEYTADVVKTATELLEKIK